MVDENGGIKNVPAIRGVNLGGWLVLEEWITPALFADFPKAAASSFHDGCRFSLRSPYGKWIATDSNGGGQIAATSQDLNDAVTTFTANLLSNGFVCIYSFDYGHIRVTNTIRHTSGVQMGAF